MVSQLTWTLAQDSVATGVRISINGEPVILSEGDTRLRHGPGPVLRPHRVPVDARSCSRCARGGWSTAAPGELSQASGPLGQRSYGLGALGVDLRGRRSPGSPPRVTGSSSTDVGDPDAAVTTVVERRQPAAAARLGLRRTGCGSSTGPAGGAALSVARRCPAAAGAGARDQRPRRQPLLVSRDGSRLVAVIDRGADDRIVVSRIRYDQPRPGRRRHPGAGDRVGGPAAGLGARHRLGARRRPWRCCTGSAAT